MSNIRSGDLFQHTMSAKVKSGKEQKVEPHNVQTHEIIFAKVYKYPLKYKLQRTYMMYCGNKDYFLLFQKLIKTNLLPLSGFTCTGILRIFSLLNPEAKILTLICPLNLS